MGVPAPGTQVQTPAPQIQVASPTPLGSISGWAFGRSDPILLPSPQLGWTLAEAGPHYRAIRGPPRPTPRAGGADGALAWAQSLAFDLRVVLTPDECERIELAVAAARPGRAQNDLDARLRRLRAARRNREFGRKYSDLNVRIRNVAERAMERATQPSSAVVGCLGGGKSPVSRGHARGASRIDLADLLTCA